VLTKRVRFASDDLKPSLQRSKRTMLARLSATYGKLGASSRGEAVDRASGLGLLEPFPGFRLTASVQDG